MVTIVVPYDSRWLHLPSYIAGVIVGLILNFKLYNGYVFNSKKSEGALW